MGCPQPIAGHMCQICIPCKRGVAQPVFDFLWFAFLSAVKVSRTVSPTLIGPRTFAIVSAGAFSAGTPFVVGYALPKASLRRAPHSTGRAMLGRLTACAAMLGGILRAPSCHGNRSGLANLRIGHQLCTADRWEQPLDGMSRIGPRKSVIVCLPLVTPARKDGDAVSFSCRPRSRAPREVR